MKNKLLLLLGIFFVFTGTTAFAKSGDNGIPEPVVSEFNFDFGQASQVKWEEVNTYYKASFYDQGKILFAFYTADGSFMGSAHNLLSDGLPASLRSKIKTDYSGYWIDELFKFTIADQPGYFIALENADQKITLKTDANQNWRLVKTIKK
ncbi:MAG TPA: hypothetical protein VGM24_11630 [Puia sp.]|jgi:hypothetical protein